MSMGAGGYGSIIGAGVGIAGSLMDIGNGFDPSKARIANVKKNSGEDRARRRTNNLLDQSRGQHEGAARDMNALTPYLYKLAGIKATFSETPRNSRQYAAADRKYQDALAAFNGTTKGDGKRKGAKAAMLAARKARNNHPARGSLDEGALSMDPDSIEEIGIGDDNDRAIDKAMSERVRHALETGESDDPRLNRELAERKANLERGIADRGLSGSSIGATAMGEYDQSRRESLADFARKDVSEYNPMRLAQRKSLAEIAGQMQDLALKPIGARLGIARGMDATAAQSQSFATMFQQEREEQARLALDAEKFRSQNTAGQKLMQLGGAIAGGSMAPSNTTTPAAAPSMMPGQQGNSQYGPYRPEFGGYQTPGSEYFR